MPKVLMPIGDATEVLDTMYPFYRLPEDGFEVVGPQPLRAAQVDVGSDHRVAMTAAVLALAAPGRSVLDGFEIAEVSFPDFVPTLQSLGAAVEVG